MKGIVALVTGFAFVALGSLFSERLRLTKSGSAKSRYLVSSVKLSGETQTSCARLVKVRMVVAL